MCVFADEEVALMEAFFYRNYATHGTCYGPSNMSVSSDIMGVASIQVERQIGGVALFGSLHLRRWSDILFLPNSHEMRAS